MAAIATPIAAMAAVIVRALTVRGFTPRVAPACVSERMNAAMSAASALRITAGAAAVGVAIAVAGRVALSLSRRL